MSNVCLFYVKKLKRGVYYFDCRLILTPCVMSFINSGDAAFPDAFVYLPVGHDNVPNINGVPVGAF